MKYKVRLFDHNGYIMKTVELPDIHGALPRVVTMGERVFLLHADYNDSRGYLADYRECFSCAIPTAEEELAKTK